MKRNVIAVTAFSQDSVCCLIREDVLIAAAKEEWFTRVRHDKSMPKYALAYCLEAGDITLLDIDVLICCGDSQRIADEACKYWGYGGNLEFKDAMTPIKGCLGKEYQDTYIKRLLDDMGFSYSYYNSDKMLVDNTAWLLSRGLVVGWYQGRMEFDQAFGNRLILMKPCKNVESLWNFQTLVSPVNPVIDQILVEFSRLTGSIYVLQASLNIPEEPIAESPENAVECFINTDMDYLIMGHYQIGRLDNKKKIEQYGNIYKKLWKRVTGGV